MIPIRYSQEQFEQMSGEGFFQAAADHIDINAEKYPDKEAYVDSQSRLTFSQAKLMADRLALSFVDMGLKKDDRIVLQIPNVVEYFIVRSALRKAGLIGLYTMMYLRHKEMEFAIGKAEATGIIICPGFHNFDYAGMIDEIKPNLPSLKHVFAIRDDVPTGIISLTEMMANPLEKKYPANYFEQTVLKPGEISELKMTSGTTGMPKLTESYQIGSTELVGELERRFGVTHDDIFAALAPLTGGASGGAICKGIAQRQGCKVVMIERFDTDAALEQLQNEKVTFATGVPTMMAKMMSHLDFDKYDLSSVRAFHSSGAYLPPALAKEAEEKMDLTILNHYGAIDIGFATSTYLDASLEARLSSVGRPMPDVTLKLIDDDGNDVPKGEVGEIVWASSKGGTMYYRDLEATLAREATGLTKTGDLGKQDEDGNLYIVGRKKDVIIRGGQNIFPAEVESLLITHPSIMNVAVVPMPDNVMGEKACAYVVCKPGKDITFEDITSFMLEKKCAKYKLPERLEVVDNFPMSGDGQKVMKRQLTEEVTGKLKAEGAIK
ncbi:MAG: acyl--CoA ligase [Chloroflexi bacterium]|mgnify:CR=1 FL=1|jgi:non-ribosomal peptide synthetase component E (peptide arylation enzyme)|nr:acyl--CoA ligase [Chloroflexota bacterium]MBT7081907.1 acyl--CoA ligase [Chloroflexota bacterium]MBT7290537.1 acyl--CoA ligase [Chloroflexota bacterium]